MSYVQYTYENNKDVFMRYTKIPNGVLAEPITKEEYEREKYE